MRLFRGLNGGINRAKQAQELPLCELDLISNKLHCKSDNNFMDSQIA